MRLYAVIRKYFRGLNDPNAKKYLLAIKHPHTIQEVPILLGRNAGQCKTMRDYSEEGLRDEYLRLIYTSTKLTTQPIKFKMYHPIIGEYTLIRWRLSQDIIDIINNKPVGTYDECTRDY